MLGEPKKVSGTIVCMSGSAVRSVPWGDRCFPRQHVSGCDIYHVLNRANVRRTLFEDDGDYAAFARVLWKACERISMRLQAYCVIFNHWHLVVGLRRDGDLSRFMNWAHADPMQPDHLYRIRPEKGEHLSTRNYINDHDIEKIRC